MKSRRKGYPSSDSAVTTTQERVFPMRSLDIEEALSGATPTTNLPSFSNQQRFLPIEFAGG